MASTCICPFIKVPSVFIMCSSELDNLSSYLYLTPTSPYFIIKNKLSIINADLLLFFFFNSCIMKFKNACFNNRYSVLAPPSAYTHVAQLHHVVLPTTVFRPILYACIGLHLPMQCFIDFKHACDLWIELIRILTFINIFCSILFLLWNLLVCALWVPGFFSVQNRTLAFLYSMF